MRKIFYFTATRLDGSNRWMCVLEDSSGPTETTIWTEPDAILDYIKNRGIPNPSWRKESEDRKSGAAVMLYGDIPHIAEHLAEATTTVEKIRNKIQEVEKDFVGLFQELEDAEHLHLLPYGSRGEDAYDFSSLGCLNDVVEYLEVLENNIESAIQNLSRAPFPERAQI